MFDKVLRDYVNLYCFKKIIYNYNYINQIYTIRFIIYILYIYN